MRPDDSAQDRERYRMEALDRAEKLEHLTSLPEWQIVHTYMENAIRNFANVSIKEGFADMEAFNLARGEVLGFNKLLASIGSDLETLNNERSKPTSK